MKNGNYLEYWDVLFNIIGLSALLVAVLSFLYPIPEKITAIAFGLFFVYVTTIFLLECVIWRIKWKKK